MVTLADKGLNTGFRNQLRLIGAAEIADCAARISSDGDFNHDIVLLKEKVGSEAQGDVFGVEAANITIQRRLLTATEGHGVVVKVPAKESTDEESATLVSETSAF